MTMIDKPYFMENPLWYYHDNDEMIYKLTNDAPQDAIDSYNEFYKLLNESYQST